MALINKYRFTDSLIWLPLLLLFSIDKQSFLARANIASNYLKVCPEKCTCNGFTVNCASKQLKTIPNNLPEDAQRLDLQENEITIIRRDDFAGLRHLRVLQLMDNEIHTIEEGAFDDLIRLERLRLNRNKLRSLPDRLFELMPGLYRLDLSENFLSVITADQLNGPKRLKNLQLDKNFLTCIDDEVLRDQTEMEILTLNLNNLTTLTAGIFDKMSKIRVLRLADNHWQCDCRMAWLAEYLHIHSSLGLNTRCLRPLLMNGKSLLSVDTEQMKCSGIEKRAHRTCAEMAVCPPMCTCTDTTIDCRDRGLSHIPSNLPSSTTELRLEQNHISYVPPRAFANLLRLRRLDLSKNEIVEIAPNAFSGLTSLTSLVLYGNSLSELPKDALKGLHSLQLLLLNANKLKCLRKETFHNMENLNLLSLYDNQIESLANGTFDSLINLQTLHLARNPIICDCNLQWLAQLLAVRPVETSGARCERPERLGHRRLSTLHWTKFKCKGSEQFVTELAGECQIDYPCPNKCSCRGTAVNCNRQGLIEVGRLPKYTTDLAIAGNKFEQIKDPLTFAGLVNLRKLDLSDNGIKSIEHGIFDDLTNLHHLDLSGNQLTVLSDGLLRNAVQLQNLQLQSNHLQCITDASLQNLTELRHLSLANNPIRCIMDGAFGHLKNLISLDLSNMELLCNCHMSWLSSYAKEHRHEISGKLECHDPVEFRGQLVTEIDSKKLICAAGSENACLPGGKYCPLGCQCDGTVVRCSQANLKSFPNGLPLDTTELYLDTNHIGHIPLQELTKLTNLNKLSVILI